MTAESAKPPASRRTFLAGTGAAAAAAALLGGPLAGTARAAGPACPPGQFAPVPTRALGPPVNADGYFAGQIKGDLHGPNHTPDNIFIWAPGQQTLMLVDVIFPRWAPFKNVAVSQDIPGWIGAQDIAMSYPWHTLVAGHLGRLGTRGDAELQIAYVADLQASARATLQNLDPTPFFKKYGDNAWAIFKAYLDAASAQAAAPVTKKYLGKLAAADVFTFDNAFAVVESLRIDGGVLGPFGIHP
jgi:glyoxylase-like metal-dependent hydrolase (beta-lactamase superfamily II)